MRHPLQRFSADHIGQGRAIFTLALAGWIIVAWLVFVAVQIAHGAFAIDAAQLSLPNFLPYLLVGFVAQVTDSAIGMGFGVLSQSFLLAGGASPRGGTLHVHLAETLASASSALSHIWRGNVDWKLFFLLVIPGLIGCVLGSLAVSWLDQGALRPLSELYLAGIGLVLLVRAARPMADRPVRFIQPLGFIGGLADAAGGGGWGPVVGGVLLARGVDARLTVGTVDTAEFLISATAAALLLGALAHPAASEIILGLSIGGILGAPIGARLAGRMPPRTIRAAAGVLMIAAAAFGLSRYG